MWGSENLSLGSGPATTFSTSAASATVVARTPRCDSDSMGLIGKTGMTPQDGLIPKTPQKAAGIRTDPAPSLPIAAGPRPAATAAAAPPLEPPAVRSSRHGLRAGPLTLLPESPFQPNSLVVVLPRSGAPASRSRSEVGVSNSGTQSASSSDPIVVRTPRVTIMSLIEIGTPQSAPPGPPAPPRSARSAATAACRASSAVTVTKAVRSPFSRSILPRTVSATSTGLSAPDS